MISICLFQIATELLFGLFVDSSNITKIGVLLVFYQI